MRRYGNDKDLLQRFYAALNECNQHTHGRSEYAQPFIRIGDATEVLRELGHPHNTHRRFRRSKWWGWLCSQMYVLGITSGGCWQTNSRCKGCRENRWRGRRPYILGKQREWWRCLLRFRHIRGDVVGFGFCGKCVPWFCCGSTRRAHLAGCTEDV